MIRKTRKRTENVHSKARTDGVGVGDGDDFILGEGDITGEGRDRVKKMIKMMLI